MLCFGSHFEETKVGLPLSIALIKYNLFRYISLRIFSKWSRKVYLTNILLLILSFRSRRANNECD